MITAVDAVSAVLRARRAGLTVVAAVITAEQTRTAILRAVRAVLVVAAGVIAAPALAVRVTAVIGNVVAVVALLAVIDIDHAVAAAAIGQARLATLIARDRVAVVADLPRDDIDDGVAAGLVARAIRAASIAGTGVAVVADLADIEPAVAAHRSRVVVAEPRGAQPTARKEHQHHGDARKCTHYRHHRLDPAGSTTEIGVSSRFRRRRSSC